MAKVKVRRNPWSFKLGIGSLHKEAVEEVFNSSQYNEIIDTRNANQPPSWYVGEYKQQTVTEMKTGSSIDLTVGHVYVVLESFILWRDRSVRVVQRATDVGLGKVWIRTGQDSSWAAWVEK